MLKRYKAIILIFVLLFTISFIVSCKDEEQQISGSLIDEDTSTKAPNKETTPKPNNIETQKPTKQPDEVIQTPKTEQTPETTTTPEVVIDETPEVVNGLPANTSLIVSQSNYLVGGYWEGVWMFAEDMYMQLETLQNPVDFKVLSTNMLVEYKQVDPPIDVFIDIFEGADKGFYADQPKIAVASSWEPMKQIPEINYNSENQTYKDIVAEFLSNSQIVDVDINLHSIIKTDVDWNGEEDVIISANNIENFLPDPESIKYSVVILIKNGEVIPIHMPPVSSDYITASYCLFTLDLDNDGFQEIVVGGNGYEDEWVSIHKLTSTGTEVVAENYTIYEE